MKVPVPVLQLPSAWTLNALSCAVAQNTSQRAAVYEDPNVLAFMDIRPISPGHLLVIPRDHHPNLFDLDAPLYGRVMLLACTLARSVARVFAPRPVGLLVAGFDIARAHVHMVPLNDYHDLTSKAILERRRGSPDRGELSDLAERLRSDLDNARTGSRAEKKMNVTILHGKGIPVGRPAGSAL